MGVEGGQAYHVAVADVVEALAWLGVGVRVRGGEKLRGRDRVRDRVRVRVIWVVPMALSSFSIKLMSMPWLGVGVGVRG